MKKHFGKFAVNSRVTIDYKENEKPKVKWTYPSREEKRFMRNQPIVLLLTLGFLILFILLSKFAISVIATPVPQPTNCTITQNYFNFTDKFNVMAKNMNNLSNSAFQINVSVNTSYTDQLSHLSISNISIQCPNFNETLIWNGGYTFPKWFPVGRYVLTPASFISDTNSKTSDTLLVVFIITLWYILLLVATIYFNKLLGYIATKSKWYKKIVPYENAFISGKGYFTRFYNVPKEKVLEIPLFSNVKLDYLASGDFGNQLVRVETREHPFTSATFKISKRKGKETFVQTSNKKKNVYLWQAKFYFKEIPKDGFLEVRWK